MRKVRLLAPVLLTGVLLLSACSEDTATENNAESLVAAYVNFAKDDFYKEWQGSDFTKIDLQETSAKADGTGAVIVEGQQVTIKSTGTYVVEGKLKDGQLVVDAEDKGTVRIIFNGVNITSQSSAAVFVKQADKTVISLEKGTENVLADATQYVNADGTDEPDATLYSKDDLTINGDGQLTVKGNYLDGIVGKDNLKITGGTITVEAVDDGISGRDLLAIRDTTIAVESGGDGVRSSNDTDEGKGNIVLESGSLTINAGGDGMQAERDLLVTGGEYNIVAGGGSPEEIEVREEMPGGFGGGMPGDRENQGGQGMPNPGAMDMDFMRSLMEQMMSDDFDADQFLVNFDESTLPDGFTMENLKQFVEQAANMPAGGPIQVGQQGGMQGGGPGQGGKSTNSEQQNGDQGQPGQMPEDFDPSQMPAGSSPNKGEATQNADMTDGDSADEEIETDESTSTKGLKAGQLIQVTGGIFTMDTLDDAIHSDSDVTINGGDFTIATGDDGLHADADVIITDGKLLVEKSYEGLEGMNVTISGGHVALTTEDDGININGGSSEFGMPFGQTSEQTESAEQTEDEQSLLLIEGGYVYVNANGDGLDSNADIRMTGGTVLVYGPENNGNGALDYDGTFSLEGGTLMAAGSSGMAMGVSDTSTQKTVMMTFPETLEAGTAVYVENSKGEQIYAVAPEKAFQTIVISTPDFVNGETYTVSYGGTLKGDMIDGYYEVATLANASASVDFTLENMMTYVNESGVTENQGGMMGSFGGGPGMPSDRNMQNQPNNNSN